MTLGRETISDHPLDCQSPTDSINPLTGSSVKGPVTSKRSPLLICGTQSRCVAAHFFLDMYIYDYFDNDIGGHFMAKKKTDPVELVNTHRPKNFKYKYIFTDPSLPQELDDAGFDITTLDTINDDDLTDAAMEVKDFYEYERDVVAKAKKPTEFDNGVMLSKKMATKTDKKLQKVKVGYFMYDSRKYVCLRLEYERFDIMELFILL